MKNEYCNNNFESRLFLFRHSYASFWWSFRGNKTVALGFICEQMEVLKWQDQSLN